MRERTKEGVRYSLSLYLSLIHHMVIATFISHIIIIIIIDC